MALVQLADLKSFLRVQPSDTTQDALLTQLINVASRVVQRFTKRRLELQNIPAEFPKGTLEADLVLRQRPVRMYLVTGTLTSGSALVTGLTFANAPPGATVQNTLVPGMVCTSQAATNQIPVNTTILSVDPALAQVTLTANALVSATAQLVFGLAVYLDTAAFAGQGYAGLTAGPFGADKQLFLGTDYMLDIDEPDGSSRSGLLKRLTGGVGGLGGFDWPWAFQQRRGTLTAAIPPVWGKWPYGNLKVSYTAGYPLNLVPDDLQAAVFSIVAWQRQQTPVGVAVDIDRMSQQVSRAISYAEDEAPQLMTARRTLAAYREVSFGSQ